MRRSADTPGIVKDWWTVGSSFVRNLLEARAVDPATGEQLVLATVLANVLPLVDPRIQCRFEGAESWVPISPNDCGAGGEFPPRFAPGTVLRMQVRVINGDGTPVPRMALDFYPENASVVPVYASTNAQGIVDVTFTLGSGNPPRNALFVINAGSGLSEYFDFVAR